MYRRQFIQHSGQLALILSAFGLASFRDGSNAGLAVGQKLRAGLKLSLAQWSLHKAIRDHKTLSNLDFASKARQLGFDAIEYVNQLYDIGNKNRQRNLDLLVVELKKRSADQGVRNVQIMVDGEGDLSALSAGDRRQAIANHQIWVDASAELGCVSTRVNLFGNSETDPEKWIDASASSLSALAVYAKKSGLNVVVENHGGLSSNAGLLVRVMRGVNMDNCGLLPDFGNFCIRREGGAQWEAPCVEQYDMYQGVSEMMPFAKGVSIKTFDFDEQGMERTIDYPRMMKIVQDSGFDGYYGIEYEGEHLGEEAGIQKTVELLNRVCPEGNC